MFYHGIHARRRSDGTFVVLAAIFSATQGELPQSTVEQWQQLTANPRVGEEYSALQRFLDNRVIESYELPHPDTAAATQAALLAAEAARSAAANAAEAERLKARLAELEAAGTSPEAAIQYREAAAAKAAEEAAAKNPPQETARGADETHNLEEAGSTPAPATNSTPTATTDGAESTPDSAPGTPANSAPSPLPLSGKKKPSP